MLTEEEKRLHRCCFSGHRPEKLEEDETHALSTIIPREKDIILLRYQEQKTLQEIGDQYGVTKERIRQIINKALRKLRHQSRIVLIKNGNKDGELKLKLECAEEIKKQLVLQKKRYPLMNEEDIVILNDPKDRPKTENDALIEEFRS